LNTAKQHNSNDLMADFMQKILSQSKNRKRFCFSRLTYRELYDCQIDCNNEQIIKCHKCILVARSEFFRNMFLGSWLESSMFNIKLPFDADLMQIIIDYLYSDEIKMDFIHSNNNTGSSIKSKTEREIEILFNLFVLSDQLLLNRLKNLCEFKLANLINLKNAVEILGFSHEYASNQLKDFCMEFISLNLVTLIESKQLETLDFDLLGDLTHFYRNYFSIVSSRMITPYADGLDPAKVDLIPLDLLYDQKFIDNFSTQQTNETPKAFLNSAAPLNTSPNSQTESPSQSQIDFKMSEKNSLEVNNDELTNDLNSEENSNKWEKVKKKVGIF
jgi:hypothetical protein